MTLQKQPVALIALLLATTVGFSACTQSGNRQTAMRPEPVEEQPAGGMQGEAPMQPVAVIRGPEAGIHEMQDAENNYRKAVSTVKTTAKAGTTGEYMNKANDAFTRLTNALTTIGRQASAVPTGERNVAERAGTETQLPAALQQKLDQLKTMNSQMEEQHAVGQSNIPMDQKRWRLVADTLDTMNKTVKGANVTNVQEIRKMADMLTQANHTMVEPKLFEMTDKSLNQLIETIEKNRISMLPAVSKTQ